MSWYIVFKSGLVELRVKVERLPSKEQTITMAQELLEAEGFEIPRQVSVRLVDDRPSGIDFNKRLKNKEN